MKCHCHFHVTERTKLLPKIVAWYRFSLIILCLKRKWKLLIFIFILFFKICSWEIFYLKLKMEKESHISTQFLTKTPVLMWFYLVPTFALIGNGKRYQSDPWQVRQKNSVYEYFGHWKNQINFSISIFQPLRLFHLAHRVQQANSKTRN